MQFPKCPVDYNYDICSSKEYGQPCETCFHYDEDIVKIIRENKGDSKMEKVRILRVLEIVGPRQDIENQMAQSLKNGTYNFGPIMVKIATVGDFPEVVEDKPKVFEMAPDVVESMAAFLQDKVHMECLPGYYFSIEEMKEFINQYLEVQKNGK